MTWEIISSLIVIATFLIAFGKIISANTKSNVEVYTNLKILNDSFNENKKETKGEIKELQETVNNHETRITVLENRGND